MSRVCQFTVGIFLLIALGQPAFAQKNIASQLGNSVFDSMNDALRVKAVASGGGGGPASNFHNLDQLFSSVYDSTNNAFKVNIIAGLPCSVDANGSITCTATGTSQNITLDAAVSGGAVIINGVPGGASSMLKVGQGVGGNLQIMDRYDPFSSWQIFKQGGLNFWQGTTVLSIDDAMHRVSVQKSLTTGLNSVAFSATPVFDASLGNTQEITLTGDVTSSSLTNAAAGELLHFVICQDAAGGHAFVWPANLVGTAAIGTTASTCSERSFIFDGSKGYVLGGTNM